MVVGGGKVQIGTEESPHQGQAAITLHGNVRATELPVYGAKVGDTSEAEKEVANML